MLLAGTPHRRASHSSMWTAQVSYLRPILPSSLIVQNADALIMARYVAAVDESKQLPAAMTGVCCTLPCAALVMQLLHCCPCTQVQGCAEGGHARDARGSKLQV